MKRLILCLAMVLASPAVADEPGAVARKEISHLISYLGSSGCRFQRNGSWYTSSQAVRHLTRKHEHLLKRGLVPSTEAFIERAATESSVSGKPYLVKCGQAPAVPSATWLREELAKLRAASRDAVQHR